LTDNEVERIRIAQEEAERKWLHAEARGQALNRIETRRIERVAVSYSF